MSQIHAKTDKLSLVAEPCNPLVTLRLACIGNASLTQFW